MDKLKKYFDIVKRINAGLDVDDSDIEFFMEYSPEIDEKVIDNFVAKGEAASAQEAQAALIQATRKLQSDPVYKQKILKIASDQEGARLTEKMSEGMNLVLAGTDIIQSINQIRSAKRASAKSRKPGRPAVPQRDALLQAALRDAQEGITYEGQRAIAPVQAQIQDQYQNDIQNARIASTGQAGAFGAYAQVAADRRNRAAMNLAPIQDEIRRGQQARYDSLLGQRLQETQNMFQNEASLYPYDLQQYNQDQQAIGALGQAGRTNLRTSLYGLGNQLPTIAGNRYARNKYKQWSDSMAAYGDDVAKMSERSAVELDKYSNPYNDYIDQGPEGLYNPYFNG